jgi:glycine/D-amino acid oxidase-like deaminating enzyme
MALTADVVIIGGGFTGSKVTILLKHGWARHRA